MDLIRCASSAPAEQLGELNPDGVQRLLNQADWESEKVMSALRAYVMEQLGSPEGVLIVDETGFLKKGNQWTSDSSGWARSGRRQTAIQWHGG